MSLTNVKSTPRVSSLTQEQIEAYVANFPSHHEVLQELLLEEREREQTMITELLRNIYRYLGTGAEILVEMEAEEKDPELRYISERLKNLWEFCSFPHLPGDRNCEEQMAIEFGVFHSVVPCSHTNLNG